VARAFRATALDAMVATCGDRAVRLAIEWNALVAELPALGPVLAQTANAGAVLEQRGVYAGLAGTVRVVPIDPIDVARALDQPHSCFAVRAPDGLGLRLFDRFGGMVHRVALGDGSRVPTFDALVARHGRPGAPLPMVVDGRVPLVPERPDASIDVAALREAWARLPRPGAVDELCATGGLTRRQAYRLVGREWARPVARRSLRTVLAAIVADGVSITTTVGNPAVVQSANGCVERMIVSGPWLVARGRSVTLRVREQRIDSAWVLSAPAPGGTVSALALVDAAGRPIVALAGDGTERWSRILSGLPAA
jgi:putative hemin transport protein